MIPGAAIAAGVASFVVALAISALLTPLIRRWALKRDFVDHPVGSGSHKTHLAPTAFGGGIAITVAILVPMAIGLIAAKLLVSVEPDRLAFLTLWAPQWPHWVGGVVQKTLAALGVIAGALILHLLGLIDDHRPLSPWLKLGVQTAVALMITGGVGIRSVEALTPVPALVLTALWIVVLTNAFNFMDNMDGLSAGVATLTGLVLAVSALLAGQIFVPCLVLLVAGATAGFLIYNFPPASIFMGDAGSLVVGYMLAVCAVLTTFYDPDAGRTPFGVFVPLAVFAVPLYDVGSVVVQRMRRGVSIFRGDRRHFSHRLVRRGMSPRMAVLTIYLATLATSLAAIPLPLSNWPVAVVIFGQLLCVIGIIAILESNYGA